MSSANEIDSSVVVYGKSTLIHEQFRLNEVFPARNATTTYIIYASNYGPFGSIIATNSSPQQFILRVIYTTPPGGFSQISVLPGSNSTINFQNIARVEVDLDAGQQINAPFEFDLFLVGPSEP